jgi:hypothetical protein
MSAQKAVLLLGRRDDPTNGVALQFAAAMAGR